MSRAFPLIMLGPSHFFPVFDTMATIKASTITARCPTVMGNNKISKKQTEGLVAAVKGHYIARPVIFRKFYEKPSEEACAEYNSNQREMRDLFSDFSVDKRIVAMRKLTAKIGELTRRREALFKRVSMFGLTKPSVSYSTVVTRSCVSEGHKYTSLPTPKPTALMSRYAARRDYTRAYKEQLAQRQTALELVKAMAARRPRVIRASEKQGVNLVRRVELLQARKMLAQERRFLRRHPAKEVASFPIGVFIAPVEKEVGVSIVMERPGVARSTSVRQVKCKVSRPFPETEAYLAKMRTPRKRDTFPRILHDFLRGLLRLKRGQIRPQMDVSEKTVETPNVSTEKSNVVITATEKPDTGKSVSGTFGFAKLSVAVEKQVFSTFTDRWIKLGTYKWDGSSQGAIIKFNSTAATTQALEHLHLPYEILNNHQDSQNAQILLNHRFFRCGFKIRCVLNSSPWQIGALVFVWTYGEASESKVGNVFSALQRNHAILMAGASNSVELTVPYHHWNSYISNGSRSVIGHVTAYVLDPLTAAAGVASTATITLYCGLEDVDARGLLSRDIGIGNVDTEWIQGQMDSIADLVAGPIGSTAINVASTLLKSSMAENRDKPPMPLQPASLIPQTMSSFAYTDNVVEPINVLRADPRGQRVNPRVLGEMDALQLARKWGYLTSFDWSMDDPAEKALLSLAVDPLVEPAEYPEVKGGQTGIKVCVYPPVAVIASMAARYRGDLEYKFLAVANSFYTGTLAISCIPDYPGNPGYKKASRSATTIADLKKMSEFVVRVPYNWYNAWNGTRSLFTRTGAKILRSREYASLVAYVVNPLIGIDKIPNKIRVLVFVRASTNFEFAMMRPPILSPSIRVTNPPSSEYLTMYNTELALYTTTSFRARDSKGRHWCVPFIQNVSDGFEGVIGAKPHTIYTLSNTTLRGLKFRLQMKIKSANGVSLQDVKYGVVHPDLHTANAQGLVLFYREKDAEGFVNALKSNTIDTYFDKYPDVAYYADGPWSETSTSSTGWKPAQNVTGDHPVWLGSMVGADFEIVKGQMDTSATIILEKSAPTTSGGLTVYGERFPDLKGLARRWQHYGSVSGKTCRQMYPRDCGYFCKIPVRPSRMLRPTSSASYDNRNRDGVIPLINSSFYLWDGSIRYRIIPLKTVPSDTVIYVQHKFDDSSESYGIVTQNKVVTASDMLDTHYPTYAQSLSVNPVVTVEVPYCKDTEQLLTKLSEKIYSNGSAPSQNGYLYIYVHSSEVADIQLEIWHAVGDDFQWSVFQGFPPMIDISQIAPEPQMDTSEQVIPNGLGSLFTSAKDTCNRIDSAAETITTSTVKVTAAVEEAAVGINALTERLTKFVSEAKALPESISTNHARRVADREYRYRDPQGSVMQNILGDLGNAAYDYVSHILYCIASPTPSVIGLCIFNIYRTAFGFTTDGLSPIVEEVSALWQKVSHSTQRPQNVKGQMDDNHVENLSSVIFCALCSLTKVAVSPPTSWRDISKGLFDFSNSCKAGTIVGKFIKDNIELFRRIFQKFLSVFSVGSANYKLIAGLDDTRLRNWLEHSMYLISPSLQEKVYTHPMWAEKVFEMAVVGRAIRLAIATEKTITPALSRLIHSTLESLIKLEQSLINRKVFCGERYEPFCLWVYGDAGCGKTRWLQNIANDLAEQSGSQAVHTYHTITINQQYFDGFVGQPSILIDDFLTTSPATDPTANMFIQMKSSALFNPPYSDVKDKSTMVNFRNLLISSNFPGVYNKPGIHDESAYNRRRDVVLKFEAVPHTEEWTEEDYKDCKHFRAFYAPDRIHVTNDSWIAIEAKEGESYAETLRKFTLAESARYHERESASFSARIKAKLERINRIASSTGSVDEYLKQCSDMLKASTSESTAPEYRTCLDSWMGKDDVPQGQMRTNQDEWPHFLKNLNFVGKGDLSLEEFLEKEHLQIPSEAPLGVVVEPVKRSFFHLPVRTNPKACLHSSINLDNYYYNEQHGCYELQLIRVQEDNNIVGSFPIGPCLIRTEKGVEELDTCLMNRVLSRRAFQDMMITRHLADNPELLNKLKDSTYELKEADICEFPASLNAKLKSYGGDFCDYKAFMDERSEKRLKECQAKMQDDVTVVGETVVPKTSRWKSVPQAIWSGLVKVGKLLYRTLDVIGRIVGVICQLSLIAGLGAGIWGVYQASKSDRYVNDHAMGNLHPSGDFKTIRQTRSVRSRALDLMSGHKEEEISVSDEELMASIPSCGLAPTENGCLRKIMKNTFWLVGIKKATDTLNKICRVRCLGLEGRRFIVLKHYIEHFEANGYDKVALVYYKRKGVEHFTLKDITFEWTKQGYGVGTFPHISCPFSTISKYMPRESFSGVYPREMIMVEVGVDGPSYHHLSVEKLVRPKTIPSYGQQSSWTIEQGFVYDWGGEGRCMSFLFCPTMASPLVGIHTAGAGNKLGFAETLLRETFVIEDIPELEYVRPNMEIREGGTDLPGDGYVFGHVEPSKAVNIPNKTKIRQSEIHGVFPVKTQPAPLTGSDSRLKERVDPLDKGIEKRCEPTARFDQKDLQVAYRDYVKTLTVKCKPVRTLEDLSITQAVEGLPLPGYEPLTMTTSEGYPWILDRPQRESGKAWMFQMDETPEGNKLRSIYRPLLDTVNLKNDMCFKQVVPFTYFTMMLKDARIPNEKISIPGKTRVFEMSPVDLTIRQRQWFMDFYAAFSYNRMDCENTLGINPDGPEWTNFAERLSAFSDYILTADFSAFGPRLNQEVIELVDKATIAWYDHWQYVQEIDEETIHRGFLARWTLSAEMRTPAHVFRDAIVSFPAGQDSGNAGTAPRNSQANSLYIRAAYLKLARKHAPQYADMYWFHIFVLLFTNGDDLIMAVKKEIIEWFNNHTLIEFFAELDIKMTDAAKNGIVRKCCSLEEASYLKRGFLKHPTRPGQWLAPLEERSITDTANWIWQSPDERAASLVNSEMCARLAYTRGPEFYGCITRNLARAWLAKGVKFDVPSWESLDKHVWEGTEGPRFRF